MPENPPPTAPFHPSAGTVLVSEWIVGTPERGLAATQALLGEWRDLSSRFRPHGFLRLSCFAAADGEALLCLGQWTGDEEHTAFVRRHRQDMVGRIDQEVPGIERPGLRRYRVRHRVASGPEAGAPGAALLVRAELSTAPEAGAWCTRAAARLQASPDTGWGPAWVLGETSGTRALVWAQVPEADGGSPILPALGDEGGTAGLPQRYRLLGSVEGPAAVPQRG
ncbi:antibiotic biosynthesis monooxygenase [Streptomyces sp. NPDC059740]|uniref:antibiotic biosynthesis monooxygenase n=1 Tax=Streptomyces sp. NPDC059740 TaxID=3346926 RepID=UPI00365D98CB